MASLNTSEQNTSAHNGKRTLQRLRREAGFRSAREFAEALSIPASTYGRYENQPDGPSKSIPLASAWLIADKLVCSIDLVVGREDIDAVPLDTLQTAYDALSLSGKTLLNEYVAYLQYREAPKGGR